LPCKWASNAAPLAVAKGLPAVGELLVELGEAVIRHPLRPELAGVLTIDHGVQVSSRKKRRDWLAFAHKILAREQSVFIWLDGEARNGRANAQGFPQDLKPNVSAYKGSLSRWLIYSPPQGMGAL